ncbi:hypothetical protein [Clostridium celatum]|uniref:hypothetical protein n=1 Tax=Clostridium celatum TaxID=36834 RepID=UPI0018999521|nr:hypothetical protein [Clostridium celatum]
MFQKTDSKKFIVAIRVTESEKSFLEEFAKKNGYDNVSNLIRSILIEYFKM